MDEEELARLLEVVLWPERRRDTVEERVQALADKQVVRDLIMTYGYLCDARRWDDLLELYTDDIERVLTGSLTEVVQGKEVLRQKLEAPTLERRSAAAASAPPPEQLARLGLRHLMASDVVRLSDDGRTAWAAVQYTLVATAEDESGFRRGAHEGSYVFEFRKEGDAWRFCRQVIASNNAHNPMFQRST